MKLLLRVLYAVLGFVVSLFSICCLRTLLLHSNRTNLPEPCTVDEEIGYVPLTNQSWTHFKEALSFKTVSYSPGVYNKEELQKFKEYILNSYQCLFSSSIVTYEIVNEYSLLIHVRGEDNNLMPYLLAGHLDVVPVIQSEWEYDGFGATETDNDTMVYARGAIDDKAAVIGILEALSYLVKRGIRPRRAFYIAFGHDEETSGKDGARHIALELKRRGVKNLFFILDEGTPVIRNFLPGLGNKSVAAIGVTEKGSLMLNLSVHMEGGHSSLPPPQTSIGVLGAAISKLEANLHRFIFDEITQNLVNELSFEMSFPLNVIASNLWLFKHFASPFLKTGLVQALVRTTTAVTMFSGGIKANVIPPSAWAIVNHRIHPKQTIDEIIKRNKKIIDDPRVKITTVHGSFNPPPISPHNENKDHPYSLIRRTILEVYPKSIPVPTTLIANTDTSHYLNFTKHIFRHLPFILDAKTDLFRIHGRDERLSKKNFESMMNFYYHLMRNSDEDLLRLKPHSHSSDL